VKFSDSAEIRCMSKEILEKLATEIQSRYEDRYPSKLEFSYSADVDERTIRRILKGNQNISILLLHQICLALDTSIGELFHSIEDIPCYSCCFSKNSCPMIKVIKEK
jgi:transcriptional regulator with XRE-family HTH domain